LQVTAFSIGQGIIFGAFFFSEQIQKEKESSTVHLSSVCLPNLKQMTNTMAIAALQDGILPYVMTALFMLLSIVVILARFSGRTVLFPTIFSSNGSTSFRQNSAVGVLAVNRLVITNCSIL